MKKNFIKTTIMKKTLLLTLFYVT